MGFVNGLPTRPPHLVAWDGRYALAQYAFMPTPEQPRRGFNDRRSGEHVDATWRYIGEAYGRGVGIGF